MKSRFMSFITLLAALAIMLGGCTSSVKSPTAVASPQSATTANDVSSAEQQTVDDAQQATESMDLKRPRYEMSIVLDTQKNIISGQVTIYFKNSYDETMKEICLQLYQNTDKHLTDIQKVMLDENEVSFKYDANTAIITPIKPIAPWKKVKLDVFFSSKITARGDKLGDYSHGNGIYALSRFYPALAVYRDGQWITTPYYYNGDPYISDASDFDVRISMPADQKPVFGGHILSNTVEGKNRLVHVTASPARTFCFSTSANYKTVSKKVGNITITAAYANGSASIARSMLGYAEQALSIFQQRFGQYPYDYLVLAEAPLRSGGMEYSGIALYAPAVFQGRDVEREVVHEIAHQWWFNMVGNDEFREPWLDEGITRYSEVIYYEARYGAQRKNQALAKIKQRLKTTDDAILDTPVWYFSKSQYYILVYDKGALFHDALRKLMGDDLYFSLLHQYLEEYKWGIATTEDFQKLACEIYGNDEAINKLCDQWLYH